MKKFFTKDLFFKCKILLSIKESIKYRAIIHIFKNTEYQVSKTSNLNIEEKFGIGRNIDYTGRLKTTFIMQKNSTLNICGKFYSYTGSKIVIHPDAILTVGNGSFMNVDSKIYCKEKIDGIVFLTAFPCGLDSLVNELVMRKIDKPYLNLVIDDLDSLAGMETRIESFVDIIEQA